MAKLAKLPPRMATMGSKLSALPHVTPADRPAFGHDTSRHARGYGTAWTKLRKIILKRDNYMCQACLRQGTFTALCVRPRDHAVDHITPKAHGGTDDQTNLESLCADCHAAKTAREWQG